MLIRDRVSCLSLPGKRHDSCLQTESANFPHPYPRIQLSFRSAILISDGFANCKLDSPIAHVLVGE